MENFRDFGVILAKWRLVPIRPSFCTIHPPGNGQLKPSELPDFSLQIKIIPSTEVSIYKHWRWLKNFIRPSFISFRFQVTSNGPV